MRRGLMRLTYEDLEEALGLPAGTDLLAVHDEGGVLVIELGGVGMPEVPEGASPPQVTPVYGGDGCGGTIVTGWHA